MSAVPARHNNVEAFHEVLRSSRRILALCGAGLSASSGLATFRGAGGYWRNYDATALASYNAFKRDPGLVWLFYAYRRHMALKAKPNAAHHALTALAQKRPEFLCLTQNVDNLSQRAQHPPDQLMALHGNLFNIKCSDDACDWVQRGNVDDPFCPALKAASVDATPEEMRDLLNPILPLDPIPRDQLPSCPKCKAGLQRPAVVWFGETLDEAMLRRADAWMEKDTVDLMLVIGTAAQVEPAAGYIRYARKRGASVVVVNPEAESEEELRKIGPQDFAFAQDAAEYLPLLLEPVIGKAQEDGSYP
ncbi:hypothetical protein VHEMI03843 [[Torrubiella] hemipterigena]|uniref:Deacetylase sirtuin-type domain-containing protein n=1 Tax=[Torrubiella] hemipterigena TaxID=1531966 RepID=A0A0A1STP3_9HYPO|nr:hypothetical protein VHEMI03843 [[Torrubiella] hemipterigena]